jgi:hypothetical protein
MQTNVQELSLGLYYSSNYLESYLDRRSLSLKRAYKGTVAPRESRETNHWTAMQSYPKDKEKPP